MLYDNHIAHNLTFEPSLFENAIKSAWRYIDAGLTSNRYRTRSCGMLKLSVAASLPSDQPSMAFKQLQDLTHFHLFRMPQFNFCCRNAQNTF